MAEEEAAARAVRAAEIAEEARVSAESPAQDPVGGSGLISPSGMVDSVGDDVSRS